MGFEYLACLETADRLCKFLCGLNEANKKEILVSFYGFIPKKTALCEKLFTYMTSDLFLAKTKK